jgi:hypothetical protein
VTLPVSEPSRWPREVWARMVLDSRIMGSNPTVLCVVLSCVGRGLAICRSPVQGILPKCLNGFIVTEVNSEKRTIRHMQVSHVNLQLAATCFCFLLPLCLPLACCCRSIYRSFLYGTSPWQHMLPYRATNTRLQVFSLPTGWAVL